MQSAGGLEKKIFYLFCVSAGMSKAASISNLDSSNLYNKVMPLAASNNAPFEQTFRIKIFLPRDQLYVVRVGAKTKLQTLLENVCLDKQLDQSKYEFQHPGLSSIFSSKPKFETNFEFLLQLIPIKCSTMN